MAKPLRPKRGTTAKNDAFTGLASEITIDTNKHSIRVHDGVTAGGHEILPKSINDELYERAGRNPNDFLITATGTSDARPLANRFADVVNVKDFGAVGDGVANDTEAINSALQFSKLVKKKLLIPSGTYLVNGGIVCNYANIDCEGTIKKVGSAVGFVFLFNNLVDDAVITGIKLDCDNLSSAGILVSNANSETRYNVVIDGCSVNNVRKTSASNNGVGISVSGYLDSVRVVNCEVNRVSAEAGAIVPQMYGISGIVVGRTDVNDEDSAPRNAFIDNCLVDGVFGESIDDIGDQDGIKLFMSLNREDDTSSFERQDAGVISNAQIRNVRGRSIKMQAERAIVSNVHLTKDVECYGGGEWVDPDDRGDIECQSGGATISNIDARYFGVKPSKVIMIRSSYNILSGGVNINAVRVMDSGTQQMQFLVYVVNEVSQATESLGVNISGVDFVSAVGIKNEPFTLYSRFASEGNSFVTLNAANISIAANISATPNLVRAYSSIPEGVTCSSKFFINASNVSSLVRGLSLFRADGNSKVFFAASGLYEVFAGSSAEYTTLYAGAGAEYEGRCSIDYVAAENQTSRIRFRSRNGNSSVMDFNSQWKHWGVSVNDVGVFRASQASVYPSADNGRTLGTSGNRWSQLYAGTATINTSDAREKVNISDPEVALMRAWSKVNFAVFQFKDAYETKGEDARLHVGVVAQQVVDAFASEGLDAARYGLLCFDKWDDQYEDDEVVDQEAVLDEEGNVLIPAKTHIEQKVSVKAGDRYGIRYEEALALECAYQRWRLSEIEKRLS